MFYVTQVFILLMIWMLEWRWWWKGRTNHLLGGAPAQNVWKAVYHHTSCGGDQLERDYDHRSLVVKYFFNPPSLVLKAREPTNALVMLAESLVMLSYTVYF